MKHTTKGLLILLMATLTLAGGLGSALAQPGMGKGMRAGGPDRSCDDRGFSRHHGGMAQMLNLSEEQETKIQAIIIEERQKVEPLRAQLAETRDEMSKLSAAGSFDEAAVRALAEKKAKIHTELSVAKARTQSRIQAELTPEQRALTDKLRPGMKDGRRGKGRFWDSERYSRRGGNLPPWHWKR
ncbi:Spy/CpxP family protein refolding chaperone [Trichloromonas sp.]|uniref:Spy/CpxP family protein refolding chaperone n=1 Tax=Trichloromonas sp. TaxID=3069249 RepID=UPI002A3D971B|nr:Spy/CpxP family protein refolding chaperone [Trichloromonas sp.]